MTKLESDNKLVTFPIFMLLIYVVCTFFPIIYMYMPFLGKIKIVLLAGVGLLISYIFSSGNYTNSKVYRNPVFFAWAGFLAVMVMSLLVSYDRGLTLKTIESNVKYFIVFLVMVKIIDSDKRLDLILGILAACGVGMAVSTVVNYLFLGETFRDSYRAMALETGIFGDPNDLAMLFNVTLAFLLYFFVTRRKKLFALLGIITTIAAVMFTYSRGGFLGLCAVALGFLFSLRKNKKGYVLLLLAVGVVFWTLAPENYKERISTIKEEAQVDEETGKYKGRMEAWKVVIREGMNRPFLGAGAGCSLYVTGPAMRDWRTTHNSFIQVFAEMGLIGLLFFVFLFILPYKQYRRFARHNIGGLETQLQRYGFTLLSFASFATTAFFLPQAYSPILYMLSGFSLIEAQLICKSQT